MPRRLPHVWLVRLDGATYSIIKEIRIRINKTTNNKENLNTPLGPRETSEQWRAQARIQTSVHTLIVWGRPVGPRVLAITVLGRITEKSAWYTAVVLERTLKVLIERNILQHTRVFTKWSDNAVAYKSKVALSFTACHWMQMFGIQLAKGGLNETNECFSWVDNYGEPCHLKGKVDRYYGKLKGAVLREAKGRIVKGMHDIKSVLERSVTARPHRPDAMEEVFIEHWPECDRADWIRDHRCIAVSSMPCKIRASNCYSHTMNDVRRRRVLGDDGALITAVTTRAHGLPGLAAIPRKKIEFCEFEPPLLGPIFQPPEKTVQASDSEASTGGSDSEAATSESDAAVEADFTEVPENQAVYRGWKCSYRTKKAEQPKKKKLLKKNKARNALYGQSINHDRLELATRHMQTAGVDRAAKLASRRLDQDAAREARRKFADPPSDCNSSSSSRSGSE